LVTQKKNKNNNNKKEEEGRCKRKDLQKRTYI